MVDQKATDGIAQYKAVLRLPAAKTLLAAGLIGQLPIGMVTLPLVLALKQATGSYSVAGLAVGAYMVTIGVVGPFLGRCMDRSGAWLTLLGTGLGFVAASLALALALGARMPLWAIIAAVVAAGCSRPNLLGAMQSLWSQLATDSAVRRAALSLHSQELGFVWIVGPLLVSGLLSAFGPSAGPLAALVAAGLLGGAGALLAAAVWRQRGAPPSRPAQAQRQGSPARRASLYTRPYLVVLGSVALFEVAVGSSQVAITAFAQDSGIPSASGLFVALLFAGCIVGGLRSGMQSTSKAPAQQFRWSLLALATSYAVLALLSAPWLLAAGLLVGGMALAATFTTQYVLIADLAPPTARAESFTWLQTVAVGGAALGAALGGPAIQHFDRAAAGFVLAALCALAAAAVTAPRAIGHR